jgi:hypothetical protein
MFLPPRIGAPDRTNKTYRAATDGLLELVTPTICRAHGPKPGEPVRLRQGTSDLVRVRRVLAFLCRCLVTSSDLLFYDMSVNTEKWLPVPNWNFENHDTDAPGIKRLRDWLWTLGIVEDLFNLSLSPGSPDHPLSTLERVTNYALMPWEMLAIDAATRFETYDQTHPGIMHVMAFARLCASPDAYRHPDPLIPLVARRVAQNPDPLDVYPWVPRWAPANYGRFDRALRPGGRVPDAPPQLRRWWNLNAVTLRPGAFFPADAAQHLRLIEDYYTTSPDAVTLPN